MFYINFYWIFSPVFRAKKDELNFLKREFAVDDNEDDCCVRLRGLPYNCSKEEIYQFFEGLY